MSNTSKTLSWIGIALLVVIAGFYYLHYRMSSIESKTTDVAVSNGNPHLVSGFPKELILDNNAQLQRSSLSTDGKTLLALYDTNSSVSDEYAAYQKFFSDNGFNITGKAVSQTHIVISAANSKYTATIALDILNLRSVNSSTISLSVMPK